MIKKQIFNLYSYKYLTPIIRSASNLIESQLNVSKNELVKVPAEVTVDSNVQEKAFSKSVLDKCDEDLSHVAPYLKPSFNFAAYVNNSVTLQELLKLGVNLHKIEKRINAPEYILGLDFEKDIKQYVIFLHENGIEIEDIGKIITKNPYIFKENLDDLVVRINYLESKKFSRDMIVRIISHNPYWLMFSAQKIDERLGFFQREFSLTGPELRALTIKQPRLITYSLHHLKTNMFVIKEEMGFTDLERKEILTRKPNLFMKDQKKLLETFEYVHKEMDISLEMIVQIPEILTCRASRLKQRHLFLERLNKAQFNPKEPGYISPLTVAVGSDAQFCSDVAKVPVESYNTFLKSL